MNAFEFYPTLPKLPLALCRDYPFPNLFFPDSKAEEARSLPLAQSICAGCPERKECLEYALTEQIPHGIWAGTTPAMRGFAGNSKRKLYAKNVARNIRQLHLQGRTHKEIAEICRVELNYVTRVIRRWNAKLEGESQSQPIERPSEGSPSSSGFQQ
jgi:WhiB family redox-sensing transcriptional regulator